MRNIFIASALAIVLIAGAIQPVQAQTADFSARIQAIQQQIASLMSQLAALRGQSQGETTAGFGTAIAQPVSTGRVCAVVGRALSQGVQGDDVRALQEFLQSEGFLSANATGYFGVLTRTALARWQGQNDIESVGVVGPKTIAFIKQRCGLGGPGDSGRLSASPSSGTAPLTVTFSHYVGGFRPSGITYELDFGDGTSDRANECPAPADACTGPGTNTHTYRSDGTYTATLTRITDTCPPGAQCLIGPTREIIATTQVRVGAQPGLCTKEYMPVCGGKPVVCIKAPCNPVPTTYSNRCMMQSDGASFLYEGSCRAASADPADDAQCRAWFDGCNSCSRSTPGGMAACTLKYCTAPQAAYCTAHFDSDDSGPVACTMQYDPVCARPSGCANTCAPGMACPAICQLKEPQTYGNRCSADAEGAQFLHTGQCASTSGNWY